MSLDFTPGELAALAIAQQDIPQSATPYKDIAQACGLSEDEVINLFKRLKQTGAIRRFGASLRHQKAGWKCNAMVAWRATREEADKAGPVAAENPRVSHTYFRPTPADDWPYTFYTMVHGQSEQECEATIADLAASLGLKDYAVLQSIQELKKTSMKYFE